MSREQRLEAAARRVVAEWQGYGFRTRLMEDAIHELAAALGGQEATPPEPPRPLFAPGEIVGRHPKEH